MVQITAIHLAGSEDHQHIATMKWKNPQSQQIGQSSRQEMVDFVRQNPAGAYATDRNGENPAYLQVVDAKPPYVQTKADGKWTNNLLTLPRY